MWKVTKNHWRNWGYLLILLVGLVLNNASYVDRVDQFILDQQFHFLNSNLSKEADDNIVLIGIDEQSFEYYPEPLSLWHAHLRELFAGLASAKPKGVLLDIILPERSYNFLGQDYDRQLLTGVLQLKNSAPLVTGQTVDSEGRIRPIYAPLLSVLTAKHTALAVVERDPDGVVRKLKLQWQTEKGNFETLVGRMSALLNTPTKQGYIDYALGDAFNYVPMQRVSAWIRDGEQSRLEELFRNKIVFFGSVLPFVDRHRVPVPLVAWEPEAYLVPGVFIHMQALRTVINESIIEKADAKLGWLLLFLATLFWFLGRRFTLLAWTLSFALAALLGVATSLLYHEVWLPIAGPAMVALFAATSRLSVESYLTWREKQLLKTSFSGYVSPQVLKTIIDGELNQGVGGENHQICVLFSDIRGFTTRSEGQEPQEIISLLNRYFEEMTDAVHAELGTVDKFIGDGLMAFFGAPNRLTNPCESAFSAAKEMVQRLKILNTALANEGIDEIEIGIGLHFGNATIGHVGSQARHEYTAIGDVVNVAARLEGLSKSVGCTIVCSEEVNNNLEVPCIPLGSQLIKGHSAIKVYGWNKQ